MDTGLPAAARGQVSGWRHAAAAVCVLLFLSACGDGGGSGGTGSQGGSGGETGGTGSQGGGTDTGGQTGSGSSVPNPILFVTQVPSPTDFAGRMSTFGTQGTSVEQVVRGGDLMIRYPDGSLRNLTKEAGFGMSGAQGANAIAVREPSVHWSGAKALFSMIVGSPTEATAQASFFWQIYEVTGLASGQAVKITKVANQPANYNNVSPVYATDDRILFTSDRPRSGLAHLYPNLDEYESAPVVSGIWSLNPATGDLHILNHAPSGASTPTVDSFGRVIFTRWDHLQRDQANDDGTRGALNYADESDTTPIDQMPTPTAKAAESFPEPRLDVTQTSYGPLNGHRFNVFSPWMMNDDGTEEETLNHVGRHELNFGYLQKTFLDDTTLDDLTDDTQHANRKSVITDGGLFQLREDPASPGTYFGIMAREFGELTSNQIVKLTGAPGLNGDQMVASDVTVGGLSDAGATGGRYRNPLPLTSGALVASHTPTTAPDPKLITDYRLRVLAKDSTTGLYSAGPASSLLTPGIIKSVTWFNPNDFSAVNQFDGVLWELEAVEVVARARPSKPAAALQTPESKVFAQQNVDVAAFRQWLTANNLALIVSRNVTTRDDADIQQPFNLQIPNGAKTVSTRRPGRVYDLSHLQILQADQIRAYKNLARGRRNIAQPLHDSAAITANGENPGGPAGSVKLGQDGSMAAFVPARRALAWQTTDAAGTPIVRERVWVTFQPGEVRVCASCHGVNSRDQAGNAAPLNEPEALRALLAAWKQRPH